MTQTIIGGVEEITSYIVVVHLCGFVKQFLVEYIVQKTVLLFLWSTYAYLLQVFSSSLDTKIILWDYVDGVLLHKFELSYPIGLMFHSGQDAAGFYGILQVNADSKSIQFFCLLIMIDLCQRSIMLHIFYSRFCCHCPSELR